VTPAETSACYELVRILADGNTHSGTTLAASLGISRAAVWKRISKLSSLGIDVVKERAVGYRLSRPVELLDENFIRYGISTRFPNDQMQLDLRRTVVSTNSELLAHARTARVLHPICMLTEQQTGGRGRRGRSWHSPFGENIYLSVLWPTDRGFTGLDGLSLAIGVAVAQTLIDVVGVAAKVKWPNDVLIGSAKVGGILIEVDGALEGPLNVVVGLGLNVNLTPGEPAAGDLPRTDIARHTSSRPSRNQIAVEMVVAMVSALAKFETEGFGAFHEAWSRLDAVAGSAIDIIGHDRAVSGVAHGVDSTGSLLVEVEGQIRAVSSGEVSLRAKS
jgi:BirA family transcriptional regulator, biotin operon repressor / biotin---[acetyl-CoA-carboxylase] ligase